MTPSDQILFCMEEIERLNILVEKLVERGVVPKSVVMYAELEAQSRRAIRQAEENPLTRAVLKRTAAELHTRAEAALTAAESEIYHTPTTSRDLGRR